jgi:ubiquinone/menaquinone biosynthesis C-methylase UbiE
MNINKFTGKAQVYADARPGYPDEAIKYIMELSSSDSVFADIGAGTGKLSELLAKFGCKLFAVEPNNDMRKQLNETLSIYKNAIVINGTAEDTTLPDNSVDIVVCAQALHWFDIDKYRAECHRIGNPETLLIAIYNNNPGGSSPEHRKLSTSEFFVNPTIKKFPNPVSYNREKWLQYMTSHSHDPLPTDAGYGQHIAEMNTIFDEENVNGLIQRDVVTYVYSERAGG